MRAFRLAAGGLQQKSEHASEPDARVSQQKCMPTFLLRAAPSPVWVWARQEWAGRHTRRRKERGQTLGAMQVVFPQPLAGRGEALAHCFNPGHHMQSSPRVANSMHSPQSFSSEHWNFRATPAIAPSPTPLFEPPPPPLLAGQAAGFGLPVEANVVQWMAMVSESNSSPACGRRQRHQRAA